MKDIADYRWCSYREYTKGTKICDTNLALDMFSTDTEEAVKLFKRYNLEKSWDRCLDYDQDVRLNDAEASAFISSISGVRSPIEDSMV